MTINPKQLENVARAIQTRHTTLPTPSEENYEECLTELAKAAIEAAFTP